MRRAVGHRWCTASRLYRQAAAKAAIAVAFALTILGLWRDEGPTNAQPPLLSDFVDLLPIWGWLSVALAVALVLAFEGAHRELRAGSDSELVVTWPSQGMSLPLRKQGGVDLQTGAFSTSPVELVFAGPGTIDIRRVILLARIAYGRTTSWSAIQQMSVEERGGASALLSALSGQPMELRWSGEDTSHVRELEGVPVTIHAGKPLHLPQLWLRIADQDRALELLEESGRRATWQWSLTVQTDRGRYTFDVATPIVMQPPPEEQEKTRP